MTNSITAHCWWCQRPMHAKLISNFVSSYKGEKFVVFDCLLHNKYCVRYDAVALNGEIIQIDEIHISAIYNPNLPDRVIYARMFNSYDPVCYYMNGSLVHRSTKELLFSQSIEKSFKTYDLLVFS